MQRIYEPESLLEAQMLAGMLASEGIDVHVVGRDLVGAVYELPLQACWGSSWLMSRPNAHGS